MEFIINHPIICLIIGVVLLIVAIEIKNASTIKEK